MEAVLEGIAVENAAKLKLQDICGDLLTQDDAADLPHEDFEDVGKSFGTVRVLGPVGERLPLITSSGAALESLTCSCSCPSGA